MLILTRNIGEKIVIGNNIILEIVNIRSDCGERCVLLGITAPKEIPVHRKEVFEKEG